MSTLAQGETLVVGSSITIRGTVISHEDLSVEGTVEGTIEAREHRLIVGSQGSVRADIESREVIILGSVCGNVEAVEKIEIHKDANLV